MVVGLAHRDRYPHCRQWGTWPLGDIGDNITRRLPYPITYPHAALGIAAALAEGAGGGGMLYVGLVDRTQFNYARNEWQSVIQNETMYVISTGY